MEKGVIGIVFISLFMLFGSVAFIIGQEPEGEEGPEPEGEGGEGGGCTPDCTGGKVCGSDGCGGSCGTCTGTDQCDAGGLCVACLDDGDCAPGESCDASGQCIPPGCTPAVDPALSGVCGTQACGVATNGTCGEVNCGSCAPGESCVSGSCVAYSPGSCESIYLYSNQSTLITETTLTLNISLPITARPAEIFAAWTADIPQARWIWAEATVSNPTENTTVEFTKTFNVSDVGGTIDGELVVAADNSYSCTLNGLVVGADASENNFRDDTKDTYSLSGKLQHGENTLVCEVKNWEQEGGTPESNPAGFLYGLSVDSGDCVAETPTKNCTDTDGGVNYLSSGTTSTDEDSNTDSCSGDGSNLTEYYCKDGAITSRAIPKCLLGILHQ